VTIPEGAGPGRYVFGVPTSDLASETQGRIRYYLGGQDADKFQISENTGVVKTLRDLRGPTTTVYELEIHATDSGAKEPTSSMVNVRVSLGEAKRFPEIKSGRTEFVLEENRRGVVVTRVEGVPPATAKPPARLTFTLGGGNLGNAFEIDRLTGEVQISDRGLDFELSPHYELWVEVRSEKEPKLVSALALHITVTDENGKLAH
jgi:hypothetical protein